jgi:regulator of protease activity HflC (stomatin/prohibitin superfamily)
MDMSLIVSLALVLVAVIILLKTAVVVPQQSAYVVERLGKFNRKLDAGFHILFPFIDKVSYRHTLKEQAVDIAEQVCITRDNVQVGVDGVLYMQVLDPARASYGIGNYMFAIAQLAQTTLRSEIGKIDLDKTFEERGSINANVVSELDKASDPWGVKVLRYEIKNLTPPEAILRSMQAQITAEREKRALIAKSEGQRQEEINLAEGVKQAAVLQSEGQKIAAINNAEGEARAITTIADATAAAVRTVANAMNEPGGINAANLKVAELYIDAFGNLAKTNNTMIIPGNVADVATLMGTAMTVLNGTKPGDGLQAAPKA